MDRNTKGNIWFYIFAAMLILVAIFVCGPALNWSNG